MAMASPNSDLESFKSVLMNLLESDNVIRLQAEKVYEEIPDQKKMFFFFTILLDNQIQIEVADLGAILFRRIIMNNYKEFVELPVELQCEMKNKLLHRILSDINQNLRRKILDIVAEIARQAIDDDGKNNWPEFLKFLFECTQSPEPTIKELSLLILESVPGAFGNEQEKYLHMIHCTFLETLSNSNPHQVRHSAVKSVCAFLIYNKEDTILQKKFHNCLNSIFQFLDQVLDSSDGQPDIIFNSLTEVIESCPQTFRPYIDPLFILCTKGLTSDEHGENCQSIALEVIVTICETAPAMVRKLGSKHLPKIVHIMLRMMTLLDEESNWDFEDNDSDDDESDSVPYIAESSLDRIACALKGKTVLPLVNIELPSMLNSARWEERYAGIMAISAIGEGCHQEMVLILPQIVDAIITFCSDEKSRVRYAAINAIGQMCTDFGSLFQKKFHNKVIPALLELLIDPASPRVQAHAGAAFVNVFEDCPKSIILPYLPELAHKLEYIFNTKLNELIEKGTKLVLEQVVVTVAALADVIQTDFQDYYERFMPFLKLIIQNANQPELRLLRGKTIECVSLIGLAVGKEKFHSDANDFMDLLMETQSTAALADDDPQFSYMIAAWARMCRFLGKDFEPYLPYVMEPVLKAASLKVEITMLDSNEMDSVCDEAKNSWEFIDLGEKNFAIKTAGLEDKAMACDMLVCYARELKEGFAVYAEDTLKLMGPMLRFYFHDDVRKSAADIMPCLLECSKFKSKEYIEEMWNYILSNLMEAIESETENEVLYVLMNSLSSCITTLNYPCINEEAMFALMKLINDTLTKYFERSDARNQAREGEDYDDIMESDLMEADDDDVYLLGKISTLVSSLFAIYKEDFFTYFDMLLHHFLQLLDRNRPMNDRVVSLNVFSDVTLHGGPMCTKYQEYYFQAVVSGLSDKHPDMRQSSAYIVGLLSQYNGADFTKICTDCFPLLIQIINSPDSRSEENERSTENAISAVTKFLIHRGSEINVTELLPTWITWLPIWEDAEEVDCVYNFLCSLLEMNNPIILGDNNSNLPKIVRIIAETFQKEGLDPDSDVGKRVLTLIQNIQTNHTIFEMCTNSLEPQLKQALNVALATVFKGSI